MYKSIILGAAIAAANLSYADPYQFEVGAQYRDTDFDKSNDQSSYAIAGTYFLKPVDDSKGPLFEADFISRSSSVSLLYRDTDRDNAGLTDGDSEEYAIRGRYISPDKGWFIGLEYGETEEDVFFGDTDTDFYALSVGAYVAENTTFSLNFQRQDTDFADQNITFQSEFSLSRLTKSKSDVDSMGVSFRHLGTIKDYNFVVSASYNNGNLNTKTRTTISNTISSTVNNAVSSTIKIESDIDEYGFGLAFYPDRNWRIAASYINTDIENFHTEEYSLAANWFVTEQLSVNIAYSDLKSDSPTNAIQGIIDSSDVEITNDLIFPFVADIFQGVASPAPLPSSNDFNVESERVSVSINYRF